MPGADSPDRLASAAFRHSAFKSVGPTSQRMGRAKSSTSLTTRSSRLTSSSMSATASRLSAGDPDGLAQDPQRRLDDHQRVPHLVGHDRGQAAQGGQPLALGGVALERGDGVGEAVEGAGQQAGVLVLPVGGLEGDLAGEVAGGGHLPHGGGDLGQRPRDRAGHRVAQHRRHQHGQERRPREGGVDRAQETQPLRARAQDEGGGGRSAGHGRRQRARDGHVLGAVQGDAGDALALRPAGRARRAPRRAGWRRAPCRPAQRRPRFR